MPLLWISLHVIVAMLAVGTGTSTAQTVPSMQALESRVGEMGERIYMQGYYGPEDGAGGLFVWNDTSRAVGNRGMTVRPSNVVEGEPGRWHRVGARDAIRAEWYGLHADSLNNHVFIQRALADAKKVGGTVTLPPGRFPISGVTYVPGGVTLEGHDSDTTIAFYGPENTSLRMYEDEASFRRLRIDGRVKARIAADQVGRAIFGIYITNASHCRVEDLVLTGFGYKLQSELPEGSAHNTLDLNGQAITIVRTAGSSDDAANNLIKSVRIHDPEGRLSFAIRLFTHFESGQLAGDSTGYVRDNQIVGNTVVGTSKNAIELVGPHTVGNRVAYNEVIDARGYGAFDADFGASGNVFLGNVVRGYAGHSDLLEARNQAFIAFQSAGGQSARGRDLTTQRARKNHFFDNRVHDVRPAFPDQDIKGLFILKSDSTVIDGVVMFDVQTEQGDLIALDLQDAVDASVTYAQIRGATHCVVAKDDTRNLQISSSRFEECYYGYRAFGRGEKPEDVTISTSTFTVQGVGIDGRNVTNLHVEEAQVNPLSPEAISSRDLPRPYRDEL
jgi:hypothetical protein